MLVIFYMENGRNKSESYVVSGSSTFFDILGRTPSTDYQVSLGMRVSGGAILSDGTNLAVRTGKFIVMHMTRTIIFNNHCSQ